MKTKECSKCRAEKDIKEFNKKRAASDGLSSWCRKCKNTDAVKKKREKRSKMTEEEREFYLKKRRAHGALERAVKRGDIEKPDRCGKCDKKHEYREIHGHHHDYDKPLEVEWICRTCHLLEHGGAKTLNCKTCGKRFKMQRSQNHKFCSHACYHETLKVRRR